MALKPQKLMRDKDGNLNYASSGYLNRARTHLTPKEYGRYQYHRQVARSLNPANPQYKPYEEFSERLKKMKTEGAEAAQHFASRSQSIAPSSGTTAEAAEVAAAAPVKIHPGAFSQFLAGPKVAERYLPTIDNPAHADATHERWKKVREKYYDLKGYDDVRRANEELKFYGLFPIQQQGRMDYVNNAIRRLEHPETIPAYRQSRGRDLNTTYEQDRKAERFEYYEHLGLSPEEQKHREELYASKSAYERNNLMHQIRRTLATIEAKIARDEYSPSPLPEDYQSTGDEKLDNLELARKKIRRQYVRLKRWSPEQIKAYEEKILEFKWSSAI